MLLCLARHLTPVQDSGSPSGDVGLLVLQMTKLTSRSLLPAGSKGNNRTPLTDPNYRHADLPFFLWPPQGPGWGFGRDLL